MQKHHLLVVLVILAMIAAGCATGLPIEPPQEVTAPMVEELVTTLAPGLAGSYGVEVAGENGESREIILTLNEDGAVELVTDFGDAASIVETGSWLLSGDGAVEVTLSDRNDQAFFEPLALRLMLEGEDLVATDLTSGTEVRLSRTSATTGDADVGQSDTGQAQDPDADADADVDTGTDADADADAITGTDADPDTDADSEDASGDVVTGPEQGKELFNTFLSLRAGGSTPAILTSAYLYADGTLTWTSDYYNDQPPIVQVGTWTDNGDDTYTVELTGKPDEAYDEPDVLVFQHDGDKFEAVEYNEDIYGSEGIVFRRAADVALDEQAALVTIDLAAGFPLDPTFVSVNGGGDLNLAVVDQNCAGFVNTMPVVTVEWSGEAEFVRAFFVSDHDSTLFVVGPDGSVDCNDDAGDYHINPSLELTSPMTGTYRIWVGSYARDQLVPGVLVLTTREDVDLSTFDLGALIQRPPLSHETLKPEPVVSDEDIAETIEQLKEGAVSLDAASLPYEMDVISEGEIPLFQFPLNDHSCGGLVSGQPNFVFQWAGDADALSIFFEGDGDSTLLVLGPNDLTVCGDDAEAAANLNPSIDLSSPAEGFYGVWVGRISPEAPVTGVLTIAVGADAEPEALAPAQ